MSNAKLLESPQTEDIGEPGGLSQTTAQKSDARFLWKFDFLEIGNRTVFKPKAKRSILEVCEKWKRQAS